MSVLMMTHLALLEDLAARALNQRHIVTDWRKTVKERLCGKHLYQGCLNLACGPGMNVKQPAAYLLKYMVHHT